MSIFLIVVGIIILLITSLDIIWSTLWVDGGSGPFSDKLASFIWTCLSKLNSAKFNILSISGPFVLVSVLVFWISFIWIGWSFIFLAGNEWLIKTSTGESLGIIDTIYYAGYLIFTLGNGEFSASRGLWQIISTIASGTGMIFLTMGASYIISIISAVVQKRSFASSVLSIGRYPVDIIKSMWNGKQFIHEDTYFQSISYQLSTIVFQHKAFPLLRYYHTDVENKAMPIAIVVLDEALSILKYGIDDNIVENNFMFIKLREDIKTYLEVWHNNYSKEINEPLPKSYFSILKETNMPLVDREKFYGDIDDLRDRRKKLLALLKADGWTEDDISPSGN